MKIELWVIGKTKDNYLKDGETEYIKRIKRYMAVEVSTIDIPAWPASMSAAEIKGKESQLVLAKLKADDYLIALDEKGGQVASEELALQMQSWMNAGYKRLIFLVGGAWGIDDSLKQRSNWQLSLSKLTFTHQMVRLIFLEQIYRAFTILNNEPYHNS
ncbi:MAG: 23S rRNA (pseudouridine(1915)-N(3))-methyltransferase RlmH [Saprospiraceae bacterium]|nr:23S rRNA (pseudouridine(1915)-N(3))-methyltransferase RlmH [Saprospiraceae bacterium]